MIGAVLAALTAPASGQDTLEVLGVRNASFAAVPFEEEGGIPFWEVISGEPFVVRDDGRAVLVLPPGSAVEQPVAGPPDAAVVVRAVAGGALTAGVRASDDSLRTQDHVSDEPTDLAWIVEEPGPPRWSLVLACADTAEREARVELAEAFVRLPAIEEAAYARSIEAELERGFATWLGASLDRSGPRETAFVAHLVDADTGGPMGAPAAAVSLHPLYTQLHEGWRLTGNADWEAALVRFAEDFLNLGLHPETGLPRSWDPVRDVPLDGLGVEIRPHLAFLLDLHEHGPAGPADDPLPERALAAAARIGAAVLARGVLPDGSVSAKYVPATGAPDTATVELRRLDVPSQLARLAARTGDERLLEAAREAVLAFEYGRYWPGTWDRIDPGFDDEYGHYGARAVVAWRAFPNEASFREVALSGLETYAPLWRAALGHGGNVAADQVRCWRIAARCAELEPAWESEVAELLDLAAHVHWTGQQNRAGEWIDTTIVRFDPQNLPVGDTLGVPQNLLEGLGHLARRQRGAERAATLARFAAVHARTKAVFGAPHGLLAGPAGGRAATGTLLVHPGLLELLAAFR